MWLLLAVLISAVAAVVWNRLREADDVVVPRSRGTADRSGDAAVVYADASGGGDAGCGDGGGGGGCD